MGERWRMGREGEGDIKNRRTETDQNDASERGAYDCDDG